MNKAEIFSRHFFFMGSNTKQTIKFFLSHSWRYKYQMITVISTVILASVSNLILPFYYKEFFDGLSLGVSAENINRLIGILYWVLAVNFFGWVMWRIATFTANTFESRVMADLSNFCYQNLFKHSFNFFNNNFVGSLTKKVRYFHRSYEIVADTFLWNILRMILIISIVSFVLTWRNYWLGLLVIAWLFIFLSVNFFFTLYKLKYDIKRSEAETEVTAYLADTVTNNNTVKLFNGYQREVNGFGAVIENLRKLRRFTWDLDAIFEAVQGFLMISFEVGIFFLALHLWGKGLLTLGDFVLIQTYVIALFEKIWDFGKVIRRLYEALADADEMTDILLHPFEIKDAPNAKKLKVEKGEIEFAGVDFYYHQGRKVLNQFNLKIKPREHIALIGPSGAGKTTVVRLILRQHDILGGKILIDNQDIAKVTQESLWENISLVPQDPILFHRSLRENIAYGKIGATDKEIVAAAKAAHCHEFIVQLPQGYDTFVGERGIKLSGGERQRVAIARAILRQAPILVLDEATSSLDSESETLIQDALTNLMKNKTVIVIAHRLSTIKKMDRIIVVENGQISEEGTHQDLIKKGKGIYNHLWQLQAEGFIK